MKNEKAGRGSRRKSKRSTTKSPVGIVWVVTAPVLICVGILMVVLGSETSKFAKQQAHWRSTKATVQKSYVRNGKDGEGNQFIAVGITYQYQVSGKNYESSQMRRQGEGDDKLDSEKQFHDKAKAEAWVQKLKSSPITVFYDPEDPHQSVMQRASATQGRNLMYLGWFGLAAGLALGLYLSISFWRRRRSLPRYR